MLPRCRPLLQPLSWRIPRLFRTINRAFFYSILQFSEALVVFAVSHPLIALVIIFGTLSAKRQHHEYEKVQNLHGKVDEMLVNENNWL